MKIGFDISDLGTARADGTTRYTRELAKRLPVVAPDHEWLFFTPQLDLAMASELRRDNVRIIKSPWPKYWTQARLPWDLYRYRPDVLFMPIQQIPYVRPGKMKTVAVVHDLAVHKYPQQFTYKDWLLLHIFSSYVAREANEIIAVSQATADDIKEYYGRSDDVHVVYHGVDYDKFYRPSNKEIICQAQTRLIDKYPQAGSPYILYVGQIQPRKNLVRLIEAFEIIAIHDREISLVIAGGHGWLKQAIKEKVKNSSVSGRIHMIGAVPDDLLPALYWQAEIFVLPSLYEGFGMPVLEAMAAGCPVVTSNVSSLPEVAGQAAIFVNPEKSKSIAAGINEAREKKEQLIGLGLERAKQFTWEKTARKTMNIIE